MKPKRLYPNLIKGDPRKPWTCKLKWITLQRQPFKPNRAARRAERARIRQGKTG